MHARPPTPPAAPDPAPPAAIARDVLDARRAVEVLRLDGFAVDDGRARDPHRHDYHEILWTRRGEGHHHLDGRRVPVRPMTLTFIGRGQVHVFARAAGVAGAAIRFRPEMITPGTRRAAPGWLLAGHGGRVVDVPASAADPLDHVIDALALEAGRPPDPYVPEVLSALISTILLWGERWYDDARTERRDADDQAVQLHRRFAALLERDHARHHDAAHYATALGVPAATLSRALVAATGTPTKEHIMDRVMVEASRLLRFTGLTVGEVAHAVGYADPLYFSRVFTRRTGESPTALRARLRG